MSRTRELAGGGREVEVEPDRLDRFCAGVAERHGAVLHTVVDVHRTRLDTEDGTTVEIVPTVAGLEPGSVAGLWLAPLHAHLALPHRVGLLLVRAGGHTAGVAVQGRVQTSSTARRHVQGRTAAGGWSQQRFARRRAGQTRRALEQAADTAARTLLGLHLDVLVTGGDRRSVDIVLADPRLRALAPLLSPRWLDTPEPRRATLDVAAERSHAVLVRLRP
ncbi:MAG: acVLRF1 family peptidyl-tRNA hydrolase [Mycobacteriaceae bacterium]